MPLIAVCINASKLKLIDCYLVKMLRRRRERRKNYLKVVGGYLAKAAKALVLSKPIVTEPYRRYYGGFLNRLGI